MIRTVCISMCCLLRIVWTCTNLYCTRLYPQAYRRLLQHVLTLLMQWRPAALDHSWSTVGETWRNYETNVYRCVEYITELTSDVSGRSQKGVVWWNEGWKGAASGNWSAIRARKDYKALPVSSPLEDGEGNLPGMQTMQPRHIETIA